MVVFLSTVCYHHQRPIKYCRFNYCNKHSLKMIDQWIEELKKGNCISEPDLKKLCIHV